MPVTETWPPGLPPPLYDGYAVEPQESVSRTEMESGPARQRRRFLSTPTRFPVTWRFTEHQYALFDAWYRHKGKEGAEWFNITLKSGLGMVAHEARFAGLGRQPYRAAPKRGMGWIVNSVLEVRKRPVLSEGALELALSEDITALLAAIETHKTLINTTLPANPW